MYRIAGEHAIAADEATTAASLWYGGSGHPQDNQAHLNDLQNLANTMEALPRRGGRWTVGSTAAPWTAALMLAVTTLQGAKLDKVWAEAGKRREEVGRARDEEKSGRGTGPSGQKREGRKAGPIPGWAERR